MVLLGTIRFQLLIHTSNHPLKDQVYEIYICIFLKCSLSLWNSKCDNPYYLLKSIGSQGNKFFETSALREAWFYCESWPPGRTSRDRVK